MNFLAQMVAPCESAIAHICDDVRMAIEKPGCFSICPQSLLVEDAQFSPSHAKGIVVTAI